MYIKQFSDPEYTSGDRKYTSVGQQWSRVEAALARAFDYVQNEVDSCPLKAAVLTHLDEAMQAVDPVSDKYLWTPMRDVNARVLDEDRAFLQRSCFPTDCAALRSEWPGRTVRYTLSLDNVPGETGDPSDPDFDPDYVPDPVERLSAVLTVNDDDGDVTNTFTWHTDITALDDNIAKAYMRFRDWYHGVRDGLRVIFNSAAEFVD